MCMSPKRRKALNDAGALAVNPNEPVVQPKTTQGNKNTFNVKVNANKAVILDPALATGFDYQAVAAGPLFKSVALPYLVPGQGSYKVQTYIKSKWTAAVDVPPLTEYKFPKAVIRFRVLGVPASANIPADVRDQRWGAMVTFDRKGTFRGSVTGIPAP